MFSPFITLLSTRLSWQDMVLPADTLKALQELSRQVQLLKTTTPATEKTSRRIKRGLKVLFYGPPGTGKTITATLLGKDNGLPVYRVDLTGIVSRYIGETEKNLERLFNKSAQKDGILFFDEADALFGKRMEVRDAHDRYANIETVWLLQRIEAYKGLVIFATNSKNNLDDAFTRRLQAIIHFPKPSVAERLLLWQKILPANKNMLTEKQVELLAEAYELTAEEITVAISHWLDGKRLSYEELERVVKETGKKGFRE